MINTTTKIAQSLMHSKVKKKISILECSSTIRPVSAGVISKHNLSSTCVAFRTVSIETDTSKCSDDPSLPSALTPCSLGSSKISHRVQRSTKSWKRQAIEEIHN